MQINNTLVNLHLETIPGLGTLTARGLPGGDLEHLGGDANGALDLELLLLGALDEVGANWNKSERLPPEYTRTLLEASNVARGKGNTDAMEGLLSLLAGLLDGRTLSLECGSGSGNGGGGSNSGRSHLKLNQR